jgi:hypothetical protein
MTTLQDGLVLYLKLDQIADRQVLDLSGRGHPAAASGNPQVVPDETFGRCLRLDGRADALVLPAAAIPAGTPVSVSLWLYGGDELPQNASVLEALDAHGVRTLNMHVPWGDGTVWFDCGNDGNAFDRISQAAQAPTDYKGSWVHWVFLKDPAVGEMHIYRNGSHWLGGTGMVKPIPASTSVRIGSGAAGTSAFYSGRVAHLRIYNRVLAADEVGQLMAEDQTALAAFRRTYPLDFNIHNDDDQPVLYILDDPRGQNLNLAATNTSGRVIMVQPTGDNTVSSTNYQFAIRFRPGALSMPFQETLQALAGVPATASVPAVQSVATATAIAIRAPNGASQAAAPPLEALPSSFLQMLQASTMSLPEPLRVPAQTLAAALNAAGWAFTTDRAADGTISLYLLSSQTYRLVPNNVMRITMRAVSVNGLGGARGTRVEIRYQHLTYENDAQPIQGQRTLHLGIVNERGQKTIPLRLGFANPNTVLNDGRTASPPLTLCIANLLRDGSITLSPANSPAPSRFILSFDVQPDGQTTPWALGTNSQVAAIQVTPADRAAWNISQPPVGESPEWIITTPAKPALGPQETVQFSLANIVTAQQSGQTNLYLRYENIPGYQDGQLVTTIDKSPLLFRGSAGTTLNVGTPNPAYDDHKLAVSASQNQVQIRREQTETAGGNVLFLELYQDDHNPAAVPEVHPSIRFHHSNRFFHRIEGQPNGIHIKAGDPGSDAHVDMYANSGHFDGNILFSGDSAIQRGFNFHQDMVFGRFSTDKGWSVSWATDNAIRIVGGVGGVLATKEADVLLWSDSDRRGEGMVQVKGILAAIDKWFRIDHPTRPSNDLVHACLEGPESAVYYRGQGRLEHGRARVVLPDYFEALTRAEGRTVQLTPRGCRPFLLSYEEIADGAFIVHGTVPDGEFSWEVKAVRADVRPLQVELEKSTAPAG